MATAVRTGGASSSADASSYSWGTGTADAIPIGSYSPGQFIVAVAAGIIITPPGTVDTLTIDGVAATAPFVTVHQATGRIMRVFLLERDDLPDPAQIDIDATLAFSGASSRAALEVTVVTDADIEPLDYAFAVSVAAPGTPTLTLDGTLPSGHTGVNCAAGGVSIACGLGSQAGGTTITWTASELVPEATVNFENSTVRSALTSNGTAETGRTVTAAFSTTNQPSALIVTFAPAGDVTAPVLSNPSATATGETTADLAVDTDEGNGTLSWVVTTSSSQPSGAQIVAGQDHTGAAAADSGSQAVVGTGTQNANAAGLTEGTAYWAYFVQDDAAANRSNIVSDTFTTDDADQPPVTPIAAAEGAGGGGNRRRGRRYPYPNVIDDGWDYDAPDARAEPVAAPKKAPEPPQAPRKPVGPVLVAKTEKPPVAPPQAVSEPMAKLQAAEPAADARVAALEAEVESLRAKVERLEAARRDDEEEQRLLGWLMEDSEA